MAEFGEWGVCVCRRIMLKSETPGTTDQLQLRGSTHTQTKHTTITFIYLLKKQNILMCFLKRASNVSSKLEACFVRYFPHFKCKLFRSKQTNQPNHHTPTWLQKE